MKKLFAIFLFALAISTVSVSAYHDGYPDYDGYDGYDYDRYGYGGYDGYDRYGYDRYYGYDRPIYAKYDGLGRYRCVGSGCYATDYLYADYGGRYGRYGYGSYDRYGYGGYDDCRSYYCDPYWNENYEHYGSAFSAAYPRWY